MILVDFQGGTGNGFCGKWIAGESRRLCVVGTAKVVEVVEAVKVQAAAHSDLKDLAWNLDLRIRFQTDHHHLAFLLQRLRYRDQRCKETEASWGERREKQKQMR